MSMGNLCFQMINVSYVVTEGWRREIERFHWPLGYQSRWSGLDLSGVRLDGAQLNFWGLIFCQPSECSKLFCWKWSLNADHLESSDSSSALKMQRWLLSLHFWPHVQHLCTWWTFKRPKINMVWSTKYNLWRHEKQCLWPEVGQDETIFKWKWKILMPFED